MSVRARVCLYVRIDLNDGITQDGITKSDWYNVCVSSHLSHSSIKFEMSCEAFQDSKKICLCFALLNFQCLSCHGKANLLWIYKNGRAN